MILNKCCDILTIMYIYKIFEFKIFLFFLIFWYFFGFPCGVLAPPGFRGWGRDGAWARARGDEAGKVRSVPASPHCHPYFYLNSIYRYVYVYIYTRAHACIYIYVLYTMCKYIYTYLYMKIVNLHIFIIKGNIFHCFIWTKKSNFFLHQFTYKRKV